jgi:hypothetical protein
MAAVPVVVGPVRQPCPWAPERGSRPRRLPDQSRSAPASRHEGEAADGCHARRNAALPVDHAGQDLHLLEAP